MKSENSFLMSRRRELFVSTFADIFAAPQTRAATLIVMVRPTPTTAVVSPGVMSVASYRIATSHHFAFSIFFFFLLLTVHRADKELGCIGESVQLVIVVDIWVELDLMLECG